MGWREGGLAGKGGEGYGGVGADPNPCPKALEGRQESEFEFGEDGCGLGRGRVRVHHGQWQGKPLRDGIGVGWDRDMLPWGFRGRAGGGLRLRLAKDGGQGLLGGQ